MATDAHAHDHDEHGDDYHHHQHIATIRGNLIIFGLLLLCTALTIGAYKVHLGEANLLVALLIAGVKATLVCTFFMHLKYEQRFNTLFFLGSFLFVGVFVGYTLNDTDHRGDDVQGRRIDPANGRWAFGTAAPIADDNNGEFILLPAENPGSPEVVRTEPDMDPEAPVAPDDEIIPAPEVEVAPELNEGAGGGVIEENVEEDVAAEEPADDTAATDTAAADTAGN